MTEFEIERIARGLRACSLPRDEWTHAAHFAAAFWLLRDPTADAFAEMPKLIRAYNEACGVANTDTAGYHETITLASLRAADAYLAERPGVPLARIHREFLQGPCGRADWLLAYWSRSLLDSVAARRGWVAPDLEPLPFGP